MSTCCGKGSVEDLVNKFNTFQSSSIALKQHPHSTPPSQVKFNPFNKIQPPISTTTSTQFKGSYTSNGFLKRN